MTPFLKLSNIISEVLGLLKIEKLILKIINLYREGL